MLKLLVIFFISTSSFASTLLLEKHSISGYVRPEHSFVKNCRISIEGVMESSTRSGDGTINRFSRQMPHLTMTALSILSKVAQNGEYTESSMPCDIGSTHTSVWVGGNEVEIESAMDCGSKRLNDSPAAKVLRSMAREICGF